MCFLVVGIPGNFRHFSIKFCPTLKCLPAPFKPNFGYTSSSCCLDGTGLFTPATLRLLISNSFSFLRIVSALKPNISPFAAVLLLSYSQRRTIRSMINGFCSCVAANSGAVLSTHSRSVSQLGKVRLCFFSWQNTHTAFSLLMSQRRSG